MLGSSSAVSGTGSVPCLTDQLPRIPILEVKHMGGELGEDADRWMRLRVPWMCGVKEERERLKFTCHWLSTFQVNF
jgi:hypothetical protein